MLAVGAKPAAGDPQAHLESPSGRQTFATAQQALAAAKPGDTVTLDAGVHRGPLTVAVDRLTLRGEPGAVVGGNDPAWRPHWRPEPDIARYAYSSPVPFEPGAMSVDGRSMIRLKLGRGGEVVHRDGVGRAGRNALGACFSYDAANRRVIVSFADDRDPATLAIEAAPESSAAIAIRGADGVVLENLIITGGVDGVLLTDTADSVVRHCLIYAADAGVHFYRNAVRCKALYNDITWNPDALSIDIERDSGLAADDVWMAHKRFGTYDKWGVRVDQAGADNEVAYNYIYNVFNGVQNENGVGAGEVQQHFTDYIFKGKAPYNQRLNVHNNRVDLALDDALEPGNELVGSQWHANVVTRSRCAARLKTVTMGPFYFYDNVLVDCFDGLRLYKSTPASAKVYIYNNFVRHPTAIIYHAMDSVMWGDAWLGKQISRGTPGFRVFNNVFETDDYFANHGGHVRPNFKSDFNVFTANPEPSLILRGFDAHSVYHLPREAVHFRGPAVQLDTAAIAGRASVDLASLDAPSNLPGWSTPDRTLPGPNPAALAQTPGGPVSGLWALASKRVDLGERDPSKRHLTPMRWLQGGDLKLLLLDLKPGEPIDVELTGSSLADSAEFLVRLRDADGEVVREMTQHAAGDRADVTLNALVPAGDRMTIEIISKGEPQWLAKITRGAGSVGFDAAFTDSDIPALRKYDGGTYAVLYRITPENAAAESFTVNARQRNSGAFAVAITRPDGATAPLPADGVVPIRGQAGDYRIDVTFTKKADLGVAGPSTLVRFADDQQTPALRPMWGKPAF